MSDLEGKVDKLIVAICGHPDIPDDGGLFQDVKELKVYIMETSKTVNTHESRIMVLENGLRVKPSKKKQATFLGTIGSLVFAIIYGLGVKLGWWA